MSSEIAPVSTIQKFGNHNSMFYVREFRKKTLYINMYTVINCYLQLRIPSPTLILPTPSPNISLTLPYICVECGIITVEYVEYGIITNNLLNFPQVCLQVCEGHPSDLRNLYRHKSRYLHSIYFAHKITLGKPNMMRR